MLSEREAQEDGGLWVVVVAFNRLIAAAVVKRDGGGELGFGVEVHPGEASSAGGGFGCVHEDIGEAAAAEVRGDEETLALDGLTNDAGEGGEWLEEDAACGLAVNFDEEIAEPRMPQGFADGGFGVALPDVPLGVVVIEKGEDLWEVGSSGEANYRIGGGSGHLEMGSAFIDGGRG